MPTRAGALAEWQFVDIFEPPTSTESLLASLRGFCFSAGEDAAREVREVHISEKGEMRSTPEAHWIPFTAEQIIDASRSNFCWTAHLRTAKILPVTVTDAYEHAHGRLEARVGPLITQKVRGSQSDKGELQRYLASLVHCPAMLLNNPSLQAMAAGPLTLRLRDREDPTGATVDIEISDLGKPVACKADRPRLVGKKTILTPWMGICSDFRQREGLRVPDRLEVYWLYPNGWLPYYRSEITNFAVSR